MNLGPEKAKAFVDEFLSLVSPSSNAEWVLFPPVISIPAVAEKLRGSFIKWGGQNCYFEAAGAFTGEISVAMLKEAGCSYVLVGHSERRQLFAETDEVCAKKIRAVVEQGLTPMFCVGETQSERDAQETDQVLRKQIFAGLNQWSRESPLVVAYEPVWAIGTGKVATPKMADEAHAEIRRLLTEKCGPERAAAIQILYGGSVKPENSAELAAFPNIDGFLVGGASLMAKSFAQIGQIPL